jgi:signal transduction histidine kinase
MNGLLRHLQAGAGKRIRRHPGFRAQELPYQLLFANLNVAWHWSEIVHGPDGEPCDMRLMDCNAQGAKIFGNTPERMIGRRHSEIWLNADPFWLDSAVDVARRNVPLHFERVSTTTEAVFDCYLFSLGYPRVSFFYHDISERKRDEQAIRDLNQRLAARAAELEEVVQELDTFTMVVSHDLRAPARHIGGFIGMLERELGAALDGKGRHYLETIQRNAEHMGQLIDGLLELAKGGRVAPRRESVALDKLAARAWAGLAPEREGRAVRLELGPMPEVLGDPVLLQDVLANLLSNALKYTRPRADPCIQVGCEARGAEQVCFVRDNGVGFDPAGAQRMFLPFQRLHDDPRMPGSGIGLASARRILQRLGGRIWAEGAVDAGATFFFSLPGAVALDG